LGGVAFVGGDGGGILREGDGGPKGSRGERENDRRRQGSPRERHKFLFTNSNALWKNLRPSGRTSLPLRVHCGWLVASWNRSGCGMRPRTRPVGSQIPATPDVDPLGFQGYPASRPSGSTYLRTSCPPCSHRFIDCASLGRNFPSPWAMGSSMTSSTFRNSDFSEETLSRIQRSSNLPESLFPSVACDDDGFMGSGSSPALVRTWKPLQMPSISFPISMNWRNSGTSLVLSSLASTLPAPRSSPKEKPPGTIRN